MEKMFEDFYIPNINTKIINIENYLTHIKQYILFTVYNLN